MRKTSVTPLLLIALGAAGILLAAHVTTDYDKKADFSRYRTYSWLRVQAGELWQDRIQRSVDAQLSEKGWNRVASGGDVSVAAFGSRQNQQQMNTFYDNLGGGWYWGGFGGTATTTVENIPVGTLVVDMFDSQSKRLIWRGRAEETLSDKPEKNEKKLTDSVEDMFKHFPPKSPG
jgi:hypothetical protein